MNALNFDVVGAEGPRTFFARVTKATIAHAYLFSGPPGVGKKTFARRLAQSLLCEAPHDSVLGYDGTCGSCKLFASGDATRHPDFLEHIGALKIGDADSASGFYGDDGLSSRDIVRQLSLTSYSGGMRVLLLGDIEFATHHAANALLKFFEDPPGGVVLVLTTPTPGRLLTTIRSRLVDVRFPALANSAVREILMRAGHSAKEAELGTSLGSGSATRAIAALCGEEDSLRAQVATWFFGVVAGKTPQETWAVRETLDDGLEVLKSLARDWVALGVAGPSGSAVAPDYSAEIAKLPPLAGNDAVAVLNKIEDAQRLARTNVRPEMVSELVRMALTNKGR